MPVKDEAPPFLDVRDIIRHVGPASFARGQEYASKGQVLDTSWDAERRILSGHVAGTSAVPYESRIRFRATDGDVTSSCTCPVGGSCKHVAATLIRRNLLTVQERMAEKPGPLQEPASTAAPPPLPVLPSWKTAVVALTTPGGTTNGKIEQHTPMGLVFEVREMGALRDRWRGASARTADIRTPSSAELRLGIRPVTKSGSGNWVRSVVNWGNVGHHTGRLGLNPDHQSWLAQILALNRSGRAVFGYSEPDWIYLDDLSTPLLWPLLQSAGDVGVELMTSRGDYIDLGERATLAVEIIASDDERTRGDLLVTPTVRIDGEPYPAGDTRLLGDHGVYSFELHPTPRIAIAPTAAPVTAEQRQLLANPSTVVVPAEDADEFLTSYYPKLRRTVPVSSPDESVELPVPPAPALLLTATFSPGHQLRLDWGWEYGSVRAPFIRTSAADETFRDPFLERAILQRVGEVMPDIAIRSRELEGMDAADFAEHVLPRLRQVDDVRIEVIGDQPDYREMTGDPKLTISTVETDKRDWFDLGVIVTVDGKKVPFELIFRALSKGAPKLLLVDGSYLDLRQPVFDQLRDLLLEAGDIEEWETGLRISRYQASLWADFEDLAEETDQAVAWRETAAGLVELATAGKIAPTPLPDSIDATLRPYQLEGYHWLAFLWQHGLGGVLADDMGLGKTLQTLALVSLAVERTATADRRPFLVVAPTSVVGNWVAEAKRFAPDLAVVGLTETQKKSGTKVADAVRGADLVITSYALFRLDFDNYQAQQWAGLILDEAQFAKNASSKAHENAVALQVPFKLAITGTPMENSLTDLWSLFKIVAPGLFPSARKFREDYLRPIVAGNGAKQLQTLRKRIRPLMMRRTKELVAADLPEKQEQVLYVDLSPKHRRLYDMALQRERQKLLGLVKDMNKNRMIIFRSLTLLRLLALDAGLVDEQNASLPSAKLDVLFEQMVDVLAEGHRALVFSQFTSFLKKAAARFEHAGIPYEYLDGSTTKRGEVIERFRAGSAPVFLISLKAGGFGLNLTEADYVFLLDPWWNPAAEDQAIDRTHRIGQTRSVNVYRLVATGTIEEKVMALKEQKARLFDAVIEDDAMFSSALTAEDIRALIEG
ncbi:MAG TPA: SNF2-related protein [Naasia sp.]|jgi:superfamily II DNA or RNA helicase